MLIFVLVTDDAQPKDKAYRRYAVGVDRALSLFDTAFQDWADYISFLGRLLKVNIDPGIPLYLISSHRLHLVVTSTSRQFYTRTV